MQGVSRLKIEWIDLDLDIPLCLHSPPEKENTNNLEKHASNCVKDPTENQVHFLVIVC